MILVSCEIYTALNFEKFHSNSHEDELSYLKINFYENSLLFCLAHLLLILSFEWHVALIKTSYILHTVLNGVWLHLIWKRDLSNHLGDPLLKIVFQVLCYVSLARSV